MGNKQIPEVRFSGFTGDWKQRKLGQLSDITKLAGFEFTKHVNYSNEGSIPAIRGLNVKKGNFIFSDVKYIDDSDFSKLNRSKLLGGDIVFTYVGTVGESAIVPENVNWYLAPNVSRIRAESINPEYLIQLLMHPTFRNKEIETWIATSSQPALSMENIRKFTIKFPTVEEQTKMGNFFKQIDDIITLHQQELDTLKQTKQGFLQKMFPKEGEPVPEIRFPGFIGDWKQVKLKNVFKDFIVPMRDKPKEFSGTVPWTRIEDIQGRYINGTTSGQYVSEETIKSMNLKIIPKGSIIVSASATFGVVAIVNNDLITNQTFIGLVPNTNYDINYLYAFFKSRNIQRKMKRESAGSTIFYISRKQFENMVGSFPEQEEQERLGQFFKQLDDTITLHEQELKTLKQTKKAFLQKMFV